MTEMNTAWTAASEDIYKAQQESGAQPGSEQQGGAQPTGDQAKATIQ